MYILGQTNLFYVEELWIIFDTKRSWSRSICLQLYSDLENSMLLMSRNSNAIVIWLKYLPCSTEWIDVYYKFICVSILMVWNHLFMISMHATKSMETANSQNRQ